MRNREIVFNRPRSIQANERQKMIRSASVIVISIFLGLAEPCVASSAEERYFETRDRLIHQFEKTNIPSDVDHFQALGQLEKIIRPIVGEIRIEGFPEQGRSNLETLLPYQLGFDQVDGLRF